MTTKITEKNISSLANAGVSWQSVITADGSTGTTGVAGRGYFINTTSAAHTFTLPATATFADTILIKDYAGTFATNKLTIARNGHNIQGLANNSEIGTNRASVTLVYVDVTRGWEFVNESNVADLQAALFIAATGGTVTTSGDFKIHSFTGDGCFVVSSLGNGPTVPTGGPSNVDYLVVAGGGAGAPNAGAGGGAGGYRTTFPSPGCNAGSFPITATTYPITVGGGGAQTLNGLPGQPAIPAGGMTANNGSNSIFSTITSTGGGGGATRDGSGGFTGANGGSGGGGWGFGPAPGAGGTGNSPPTSPSQGNNGGTANTAPGLIGAGGGGVGAVGGDTSGSTAGTGGAGSANSISGSSVTYAGGGGGGNDTRVGGAGSGGPGGGGAGTVTGPGGTAGTINTGGGGGGGGWNAGPVTAGGAGGSGIVVIRYKFQ
jgi:hypothetical protein